VRVAKREVWSLSEAREALARMIGGAKDWARLDEYLLAYAVEPSMVPTVLASTFAASLELAREGEIELHQQGAFAPLFLRQRKAPVEPAPTGVA
jgi:segregation and condensation protein A